MNTIYTTIYKSTFGELLLGEYEEQLCLVDWNYRSKRQQVDDRLKSFFKAEYVEQLTSLHQKAIDQLKEYADRKRTEFNLPLIFAGTAFQQKVWNELLKVPFGKSISYLELSRRLGDEKAIRAVASANGANAISILVPCHRIIGSNGELTGYAGGTAVKHKLLQLEGLIQQQALF
jgi:methylated-DNA-[protein]-cysteine S-methyltransferase